MLSNWAVATEAKATMEAMVKLFILTMIALVIDTVERKFDSACITTVELVDLQRRGGYHKLFISSRAARRPMSTSYLGGSTCSPFVVSGESRPRPDLRAPLEALPNMGVLDEVTPYYCLLAAAM
jgi:hypothetical protein